jgi:hypothetical protein
MEHQTDPDYLQHQVYNNASDLDVRTHILTYYLAHEPNWYSWLWAQLRLPENGRMKTNSSLGSRNLSPPTSCQKGKSDEN